MDKKLYSVFFATCKKVLAYTTFPETGTKSRSDLCCCLSQKWSLDHVTFVWLSHAPPTLWLQCFTVPHFVYFITVFVSLQLRDYLYAATIHNYIVDDFRGAYQNITIIIIAPC